MKNIKAALQGALVGIAALVVVVSVMNSVSDAADYLTRHVTICGRAL